jgi:hypothetical protein
MMPREDDLGPGRPLIVLLDDTVRRGRDAQPESALESLGEILSKNGFDYVAPAMLDSGGFKIVKMTEDQGGELLAENVRRSRAEAVVLDAMWFGDATFGMKMWKNASERGLIHLSNKRVVFISQYLDRGGIDAYMRELGISRRQVVNRLGGPGGIGTAVQWFLEEFGLGDVGESGRSY